MTDLKIIPALDHLRPDQVLAYAKGATEEISELKDRVKELEDIVNAVAHVGIDFGYGKYELETSKIDTARKLMEG